MSNLESRCLSLVNRSTYVASKTYKTLKQMLKTLNKIDMRMRILLQTLKPTDKTPEYKPPISNITVSDSKNKSSKS